jgi:electron transfer flavoprotein alpha subunit
MSILVWAEHDNAVLKDATLGAVSAAGQLGEVHLLVAGAGVDGVAAQAAQVAGWWPMMVPMARRWRRMWRL